MRVIIAIGIAGLLLFNAATPAAAGDLDADKQVIRDYIDNAINKRQPETAERYFAADYIEHNPHLPPGINGKKQFIAAVLKGFSDYHGEIEDIVAEGDEVVTPDALDRHPGRPVPRSSRDGQQGAVRHLRFLPHRKRQGRRTLGCGRFTDPRHHSGPRPADQVGPASSR
jgi:predicted ester cyclase